MILQSSRKSKSSKKMNALTKQEQCHIKNHFETLVNRQSRKKMIAFLFNHFRYDTMNSWNKNTSYAHCIKLHRNLGLPNDINCDIMHDMVFNPKWCNHMGNLIDQFGEVQDHNWQVGTNGRSGGYLVLYHGCYSGKSIDQNEDFHEWDMNELNMRVDLICDFDMLVSDIVINFAAFCRTYDIIEQTIMVPKKIQVLQEKS